MIFEDLIDARIIVELSRRLNFAESARALGLPPATLSRRVKDMEDRAGLLLFERTSRAVSITTAGKIASEHAGRMLLEAENLHGSIGELLGTPRGTVSITAPVIFGQTLLGGVVGHFLEQNVDCDVCIKLDDNPLDLVSEGFDVAIRVGPIEDESLYAKRLGNVAASLYRRHTPSETSLPTPHHPDQLAAHSIGLLHPGPGKQPKLPLLNHQTCERLEIDVAPKLVCLNPWLLLDAALSMDLVVVLPDVIGGRAVECGQLDHILPGWVARQVEVNLVFPSRRLMRPAVRAFVDLAASELRALLRTSD
ncbi:MAG: LysR substrate-binding domain-containing protein [Pseudomonadota bacterium]